ncbi:ATP-binding cassette domain-containing protein [Georgenia sp. 10Sc9-8]|uniref:ATP-binding cassette domain-containing protein n=1 Tax=Georgenia halotolerans TaxID=3028317 RepID=A0ABT5TU47_9MICO|nr:ATP-binding cassette domain-containing protein [Georgenia halotolerans]
MSTGTTRAGHPTVPTAGRSDGVALSMTGLSFTAGDHRVLHDVAATVPAGALSAVVGPNGSGKSTLLRLLVGALAPDTGGVLLDGEDVEQLPRRERARRLALVEQDSPADVSREVLDVVLLGRVPHRSRWGSDSALDLDVAHRALARTGGSALLGRDFATLSGGERQRVHLVRALAQEPRLLLLDEPTNHLDVAAQLTVLDLARQLTTEGVTVLAALHDLNHALRYCDHVLVLDEGRVAAAGPPAEVLTEDLVGEVYGVRARRVRAEDRELLLFDPA